MPPNGLGGDSPRTPCHAVQAAFRIRPGCRPGARYAAAPVRVPIRVPVLRNRAAHDATPTRSEAASSARPSFSRTASTLFTV